MYTSNCVFVLVCRPNPVFRVCNCKFVHSPEAKSIKLYFGYIRWFVILLHIYNRNTRKTTNHDVMWTGLCNIVVQAFSSFHRIAGILRTSCVVQTTFLAIQEKNQIHIVRLFYLNFMKSIYSFSIFLSKHSEVFSVLDFLKF